MPRQRERERQERQEASRRQQLMSRAGVTPADDVESSTRRAQKADEEGKKTAAPLSPQSGGEDQVASSAQSDNSTRTRRRELEKEEKKKEREKTRC